MNGLLAHLEKLQSFAMIAESGSLQGAAKQLAISQPALSLKLKSLEDAIGVQLFTRSKRGVELTTAGHALYRFSKRLISDTEGLSLDTQDEPARVRIGTFDVIVNMIARNLCALEGLSDLSFRTDRTVLGLLDALSNDEVDIAIVDDPPAIPGLQYRKLVGSPFGIFASKDFAKQLPKSGVKRLEAMRSAVLIYVPSGVAYAQPGAGTKTPKTLIDSFIEALGLGGGMHVRVDSYASSLDITSQGYGIGLHLIGHVLDRLESGVLVELTPKGLSMPFSSELSMVTKGGRDGSQLAAPMRAIETVFEQAVARYLATRRS